MSFARSIARHLKVRQAVRFQVEHLEDRLLLSSAIAAFQSAPIIASGTKPVSVVVTDVNHDGKPDIVFADAQDNFVAVALGNGDGTFQPYHAFGSGSGAPGVRSFDIAVADINGDGIPDVIANISAYTISVFLGNGNGTFQPQQTFAAKPPVTSLEVADVNGDGKPDLVCLNGTYSGFSAFFGNGNGTFQSQQTFALGVQPFAATVADVNGDGKPDLIVANNLSNDVGVLLGNGNGTFQPQQTFATGQLLYLSRWRTSTGMESRMSLPQTRAATT